MHLGGNTMPKKTSVEKVEKEEKTSPSEEELEQNQLAVKRTLCHPGEAVYQIISQWQITNQLLAQLVEQGRKRNELLEEEEDSEEDEVELEDAE